MEIAYSVGAGGICFLLQKKNHIKLQKAYAGLQFGEEEVKSHVNQLH